MELGAGLQSIVGGRGCSEVSDSGGHPAVPAAEQCVIQLMWNQP